MAKRVELQSGLVFSTLRSAEAHFDNFRASTKPGDYLSDPLRSDVLDVYRRYCAATAWEAVDAIDVTTEYDNRQRPSGGYATTKAFAVVTASGSTKIFSMNKALKAIAV